MSEKLKDRVALITGAGSGMGREHARLLAERGARVIIQDIDGQEANETATLIRAEGGAADALVCDIADLEAVARGVVALEAEGLEIDTLVNNAGIGQVIPFEDVTVADFDRMMGVHVRGHFFLTQRLAAGMKRRRFGRIVNIASNWGQVGFSKAPHYCAAKGALLALTKSWAQALAPFNVLVNAVAPGGVVTAMTMEDGGMPLVAQKAQSVPLKRFADPREIAYAVAFLVSREADFITGQVICPNGGETIVGI